MKVLKKVYNAFVTIVQSTINKCISAGLGAGAIVGGAILSFNLFFKIKFEKKAEKIAGSIAPAIGVSTFTVSQYLKTRFIEKPKQQILIDKNLIKTELKIFELLKNSNSTYQEILAILNDNKEDFSTHLQSLSDALERNSQKINYEFGLKVLIASLELCESTFGAMGAIFIHGVVRNVLEKDFENNPINYTFIGLSMIYAIFSAMSSLTQTHLTWKESAKQQRELKNIINQYCSLYTTIPDQLKNRTLTEATKNSNKPTLSYP